MNVVVHVRWRVLVAWSQGGRWEGARATRVGCQGAAASLLGIQHLAGKKDVDCCTPQLLW